ncbi:MAG TPA: hypothetical protein VGO40_13425 [Longimicrobium sp.]|nr:hypothetical protein [Longimicrobium sp.]
MADSYTTADYGHMLADATGLDACARALELEPGDRVRAALQAHLVVRARFPARFATWEAGLAHVDELSARYAE